MKYYQVGSTSIINKNNEGDEFVSYEGFSLEVAKKALQSEKDSFEKLHEFDKKRTIFWGRIYNLPNGIDKNNEEEILNAIVESIGYDILTI
jgi:hypothetical protein